MKRENKIISFIILSIICLFLFSSCGNRRNSDKRPKIYPPIAEHKEGKISKVIFYLENSESMFGYVNGATEYINVIAELSNKADFVTQDISREFYLINGANPKMSVNYLGNNPQILTNVLNKDGYNVGDITKSDLNSMFQLALDSAIENTVTILVSDAIYDIKVDPAAAAGALAIKSKGTFESFIKRLNNNNSITQTLMIKLNSKFIGEYFYTSHKVPKKINHSRPFYIWIFGEDELLNKYFSEPYIKTLDGYENYARFTEINKYDIKYDVLPSVNRIGNFKPKNNNRHILENAKSDLHGRGFQFTIGVDYRNLPFSDSYLTSIKNYICSNPNYSIIEIKKNDKQIPGFSGSHLITVFSNKNPIGSVELRLKNNVPNWIVETDTKQETNIDSIHTYGFQFLTKGITEAYNSIKADEYLATFKLQITN